MSENRRGQHIGNSLALFADGPSSSSVEKKFNVRCEVLIFMLGWYGIWIVEPYASVGAGTAMGSLVITRDITWIDLRSTGFRLRRKCHTG